MPEVAKLEAGIGVGIFEGAYQAVVDIFKGAVEMVKLAFEIAKADFNGQLMGKILDAAHKVYDFISKLDVTELAKKLGHYFVDKWNHATWFHRGEMIGGVVGYIAMNVLLALASEGGTLGALLAEAAEAGSDIAKLVMAFVKVTEVAQNPVKLLEGAGKGVVLGEDAAKVRQGLKDAKAARSATDEGEKTVEEYEKRARHTPEPGAMDTESLSHEGVTFEMNFIRDLSPRARSLVRKIEQQGFVRVDEIAKDDLVAISKWFNREIGVLQSPYGRLRIVLGSRTGVLTKQIREGEVFVAHTHPVFQSKSGHFKADLPNAAWNREAVIDWDGMVTVFSEAGIKNERIGKSEYLKPLENLDLGFLTKDGRFVGFAKVTVVDGPDGITGKVLAE